MISYQIQTSITMLSTTMSILASRPPSSIKNGTQPRRTIKNSIDTASSPYTTTLGLLMHTEKQSYLELFNRTIDTKILEMRSFRILVIFWILMHPTHRPSTAFLVRPTSLSRSGENTSSKTVSTASPRRALALRLDRSHSELSSPMSQLLMREVSRKNSSFCSLRSCLTLTGLCSFTMKRIDSTGSMERLSNHQ